MSKGAEGFKMGHKVEIVHIGGSNWLNGSVGLDGSDESNRSDG